MMDADDQREMIIVMGDQGSFGGCAKLAEAFNACSTRFRATLITRQANPYAPFAGLKVGRDFAQIDALLSSCSKIFICDWSALIGLAQHLQRRLRKRVSWRPEDAGWSRMARWLASRECTFYWTGTPYARGFRRINPAIQRIGCQTYAMPGLATRDRGALSLLQCQEIYAAPLSREPTASHSPGKKRPSGEKGTRAVERAFKRLKRKVGLRGKIISGRSNAGAIKAKAGSWFFVDRISCWGGLGKSGTEAMMLGSPTLCDLQGTVFEGYNAGCPVLDCRTEQDVVRVGKQIVLDHEYRTDLSEQTIAWARRLRYAPTIQYLESTLRWCN